MWIPKFIRPSCGLALLLAAAPASGDITTELLPPIVTGGWDNPPFSTAVAVNASGWVAGTMCCSISGSWFGVLWKPTDGATTLGTMVVDWFAGEAFDAIDIHENGDILVRVVTPDVFGDCAEPPCAEAGRYAVIHAGGGPALSPHDWVYRDIEALSSLDLWGPIVANKSSGRYSIINSPAFDASLFDPAVNHACSFSTPAGTCKAFLITTTDNIPPTTSVTESQSPNSNGWNNANVKVTLNATDNAGGAGVKQIELALGGAQNTGWQTVAGSTTAITISAEGTTILTYLAMDNAGNREAAKALVVKIDKTQPMISGMPALGCTIWPPTHRLVQVATVTATDAVSGLAPGSFTLTGVSNNPANSRIVITSGSSHFNVQLGADKDAVYILTATASDLAGNTATATAACTVPHDQAQ